jgi:hypothetical protein
MVGPILVTDAIPEEHRVKMGHVVHFLDTPLRCNLTLHNPKGLLNISTKKYRAPGYSSPVASLQRQWLKSGI